MKRKQTLILFSDCRNNSYWSGEKFIVPEHRWLNNFNSWTLWLLKIYLEATEWLHQQHIFLKSNRRNNSGFWVTNISKNKYTHKSIKNNLKTSTTHCIVKTVKSMCSLAKCWLPGSKSWSKSTKTGRLLKESIQKLDITWSNVPGKQKLSKKGN